MKKIIALLTLTCAALAFAQSPQPREHRGIYFSAGIGGQFTSQENTETTYRSNGFYDEDYNWVDLGKVQEKTKKEYNGFALPALELKLGRSLGNLLSIYFELNMAAYELGSSKETYTESAKGKVLKRSSLENKDAPGISIYPGFGFDVFPFRNPNSAMYGFYIGSSSGLMAIGARCGGDFDLSNFGYIEQIEFGKHWWITDTWSIGTSLSYAIALSNAKSDDDEDVSMHKIQLLFKIIRG